MELAAAVHRAKDDNDVLLFRADAECGSSSGAQPQPPPPPLSLPSHSPHDCTPVDSEDISDTNTDQYS